MRWSFVSGWKTTTSSILFRNSGLKDRLSSDVTLSFIFSYCVLALSCWKPKRRILVDHPGAEVRRHDDDGIPEIDLPAEAVGHKSVVEHLQQHVEDVRMGLFDLVEEHDRIGTAPDLFGQLTAVIIPHIPGRRPDEPGGTELFHVLRHVDADKRILAVKEEHGKRPGKFGLSDAGGAEENERTDGLLARLESDPRATDGAGNGIDGRILADDPLVESLLPFGEGGTPLFPRAAKAECR